MLRAVFVCSPLLFLLFTGCSTQQDTDPCAMKAKDVMLEFAYHCVHGLLDDFRNRGGRSFPSNFYHLAAWNQTCNGLATLPNCIENVDEFKACASSKRTAVFQAAQGFVNSEWQMAGFSPTPGSCYGPIHNNNVSQLYLTPTETCRQLVTNTIDVCIEGWSVSRTDDGGTSSVSPSAYNMALEVYKCAVGGSPTKCGPAGRKLAKFIVDQTMPESIRRNISSVDILDDEHSAVDKKSLLLAERRTVGVFGDPHLMTYGGYELQTCEITGRRDYLVNRFFRVSASADHVRLPSRGSALTELTISFYDTEGQVSAEYSASNRALPTQFTDGQVSGFMAGNLDITITEVAPGVVRLRVLDVGLLIYLHAWNGYYSLSLRAATALFGQSSGLLVDGCDYKNSIDVYMSNMLSKRDLSECRDACSTLNDTRRYSFTTVCVYDCQTLQNTQISAMTKHFQRTLVSIEEEDLALPLIPVVLMSRSHAPGPLCTPSLMLAFICAIICVHRWT